MKNKLTKFLFAVIITALMLTIDCLFVEPNRLVVRHYKVKDAELSGIKIVAPSDFHIRPREYRRLKKAVKLIDKQNPDIILSVGDYVAGTREEKTMPIEDITGELSKISSKYGFYTTLGNHDNWQGKEHIANALKANGIKVLNNENIKVNIKGKTLYIAGVADAFTGKPDLNKAMNGAKTPVILLSHSPDIFPQAQKYNSIHLTLAGHTHGGQMRIPFYGAIFTTSRFGNRYARGYVEENGHKLITTTGIGMSLLPMRFNCLPEIVVVEFE